MSQPTAQAEAAKGPEQSPCYGVPPHLMPDLQKMQRFVVRLKDAESLLERAYNGMHKDHWAEGETEAEVCRSIRDFLDSASS